MKIVRYSISDLEKLTGIKAHTIRIWEKRYGIISPERTETNIRFYNEDDLQRLLNIAFLNKNGLKISLISEMTDTEVQTEVARLSENPGAEEGYLSDLIKAISDLDEDRVEKNLNACILKLGFEQSFQLVVFPLIVKINLLRQIGKISSCQERFVSNLIRHKLVVAIDGMTGSNDSSEECYLLYLPAGLYDEISLLYANYLLRKAGHHVIYLGPSIPIDHLRSLSNLQAIDHVMVSVNKDYTDKEIVIYAGKLVEIFPGKIIYLILIGSDIQVDLPGDIVKIASYPELAQTIAV
jgi:MerR family transcriptional regulator, light-induced transcriptional regulator